jgi:hypothetical protein
MLKRRRRGRIVALGGNDMWIENTMASTTRFETRDRIARIADMVAQ